MPTIEEILRAAKEAGASDVHLTVGIPPKMRVNGNLITMDYPRMLPARHAGSTSQYHDGSAERTF